jgi:hypothetical protein
VGGVGQADHDHAGVLVDGAVWEVPGGFDHFGSSRSSETRT